MTHLGAKSVAEFGQKKFEEKVAKTIEKGAEKIQAALDRAEKYPECAKLSSSREEKLTLERFLDWCEENQVYLQDQGRDIDLVGSDRERFLMKYFEIDPAKLEKERRDILAEQRRANGDTDEDDQP